MIAALSSGVPQHGELLDEADGLSHTAATRGQADAARLTEAALPVRPLRHGPYMLLAAPLIVFLCAFYAYPVVTMLLASLHPPAWSFAEFRVLATSHVFWRVMQVTGEIGLIVTFACLVLAWPLAYWCWCRSGPASWCAPTPGWRCSDGGVSSIICCCGSA
jgi:ABC-type Fe3+ transport system permease subunit